MSVWVRLVPLVGIAFKGSQKEGRNPCFVPASPSGSFPKPFTLRTLGPEGIEVQTLPSLSNGWCNDAVRRISQNDQLPFARGSFRKRKGATETTAGAKTNHPFGSVSKVAFSVGFPSNFKPT